MDKYYFACLQLISNNIIFNLAGPHMRTSNAHKAPLGPPGGCRPRPLTSPCFLKKEPPNDSQMTP